MPGVDRAWVKSLWTPATALDRGDRGGLPGRAGDARQLRRLAGSVEQLRANIARAGMVGSLVANDFKSSVIVVPLLDHGKRRQRSTTRACRASIEDQIRAKYERGRRRRQARRSHARDRLRQARRRPDRRPVAGDAVLRRRGADRRAPPVLLHALPAQHGAGARLLAGRGGVAARAVPLLGFELDPYSILVPFLVFAIGVSHGAQKMNGIMQDIGRGTHR